MRQRGHHMGRPARLETASGDHLLSLPHQGEGVEGPLQDGKGVVIEQWQRTVLGTSVSDPYSLNPDPDPAKNLNPDPDPDPGKFFSPT